MTTCAHCLKGTDLFYDSGPEGQGSHQWMHRARLTEEASNSQYMYSDWLCYDQHSASEVYWKRYDEALAKRDSKPDIFDVSEMD